MGLSEYWKKRDFSRTSEPSGKRKARRARGQLSFVIQKHAATRLHYDFRLEMEGVLRSWAVPKGPSLDPADRRLAVHVEDHPLAYGGFEGTIPQGQYGGGAVLLWDRGTWTPDGDPVEMYRQGRLRFELHGNKLEGSWVLVRMRSREAGHENWLLIKDADEHAKRGRAGDITAARPESVASGRDIDEIAAHSRRVWQSNRRSSDQTPFQKRIAAAVHARAAKKKKPRRAVPRAA